MRTEWRDAQIDDVTRDALRSLTETMKDKFDMTFTLAIDNSAGTHNGGGSYDVTIETVLAAAKEIRRQEEERREALRVWIKENLEVDLTEWQATLLSNIVEKPGLKPFTTQYFWPPVTLEPAKEWLRVVSPT